MSKSLISIDQIAADCSADMGDSVSKSKFKLTRHIINGFRRLNMFLTPNTEVKTVILDYDNVVNLPCDYLYVTKVGVKRAGSNCVAILTLANGTERQVLNDTDTCSYLNSVWEGGYIGGGYTFYNAWWGGNYYGELYGMGRTVINNGTYSLDKANGIIYIGSNIPPDSQIIVEYVGNGISGGVQYVPMELKECLEFYSKWKYYADRNPTLANVNYELFKKEYNLLKRYYNHQTPLNFAAAVNASISPTNF